MPPIVVTLAMYTDKGREHSSFPTDRQAMAGPIKGADAREIEATRMGPIETGSIDPNAPPPLSRPR